MSTTSTSRHRLVKRLASKEARDRFVERELRNRIAFQIKAMRDSRGWTQSDLAAKTGTKQESVSRMEDPDYGRFSLETLRRLAAAFDVALIVKFAPFSQLVDQVLDLQMGALDVLEFGSDTDLYDWKTPALTGQQTIAFGGQSLHEEIESVTSSVASASAGTMVRRQGYVHG